MVVSDARSAKEFRNEAVDEIARRIEDLKKRLATAKPRKTLILQFAIQELNDLQSFLSEIQLPYSGATQLKPEEKLPKAIFNSQLKN